MNDYVAKYISAELISLDFITLASGVVTPVPVPGKNGNVRNVPGALEHYTSMMEDVECVLTEDYTPIIPNDAHLGVIFFEDKGVETRETRGGLGIYACELTLCCWLNLKYIGLDKTKAELKDIVIRSIPKNIVPGSTGVRGGIIRVTEMPADAETPFRLYDLNEDQLLFLLHPYAHFSVRVSATVASINSCPSTVEITPEVC